MTQNKVLSTKYQAQITKHSLTIMNRVVGQFVVIGGACLIVVGILIYSGGLNWFGRLPGDIRYQSDRVQVYIPIVSMLLVSLALSLIFYLIRKLL